MGWSFSLKVAALLRGDTHTLFSLLCCLFTRPLGTRLVYRMRVGAYMCTILRDVAVRMAAAHNRERIMLKQGGPLILPLGGTFFPGGVTLLSEPAC